MSSVDFSTKERTEASGPGWKCEGGSQVQGTGTWRLDHRGWRRMRGGTGSGEVGSGRGSNYNPCDLEQRCDGEICA